MAAYLNFEAGEVSGRAAVGQYAERVPAVVQQYGGRYLARWPAEVLESDHPPGFTVLIAFPSMERLRAFYDAPEYAPLKRLRQGASAGHFLLLDGLASA